MALLKTKTHATSERRGALTAALDVGTTKITCLIGRVAEDTKSGGVETRILGIGHHRARGVKSGTIIDMDAAEEAIRATVEAAEQMAGETIHHVALNVSSPTLQSRMIREETMLSNGEVGPAEMRRVLRAAFDRSRDHERDTLHTIPAGYSIDGSKGIREPQGMLGEVLGVNLHEVTCAPGPLRNLSVCVERCHLEPDGPIFSGYASALAALIEDEMDLGTTLIEMGGGTTSIASFVDGRMIFAKTLGLGGVHVTNDLARGLSTPLAHAERMKVLYGSTLASPNDDRELIDVPPIGDEARASANHVPRSMLVGIIRPRIEETLEHVRDALKDAGVQRVAGHRIVLTGGACQLSGLREFAARIFDGHVRIGRPLGLLGLPEATSGPAFTTAAGLLTFADRAPSEAPRPTIAKSGLLGFFRRMGPARVHA